MPQLFLGLMFQPNSSHTKRTSNLQRQHSGTKLWPTLWLCCWDHSKELWKYFHWRDSLECWDKDYLTCCRQNQMSTATNFISRQICLRKDCLSDHECFPFLQQRKELHQVRCAPLPQINMLQHMTLCNAPGLQTGAELQALKWFKKGRITFTWWFHQIDHSSLHSSVELPAVNSAHCGDFMSNFWCRESDPAAEGIRGLQCGLARW